MQAAIFEGPEKLSVVEFSPGRLSENELLVKIGACGVCATDFHIYHGKSPAKPPVVIGHEFTGEIVEVGPGIRNFNIGDRVAVDPNIPCNECEFCRSGKINLCRNLKALGVTIHGGFSNFTRVPVSQAYLLPNDFPFEKAAFAEPLSCCIQGLNQADIKMNDNVTIIGAGNIGLLMLQLARLISPGKIYVIEKFKEKRSIALYYGADLVVDPSDAEDLPPTEVVIECVGSREAAEITLKVVKHGGRIVIFGLAPPDAILTLPLQTFFHKELTIKSSLLNPFTFKTAVDLLVSGKIRTDRFNIGKISLSQQMINNLFQQPRDSSIIKYMLLPEFSS